MEHIHEPTTWVDVKDHLINNEGIWVGTDIIRRVLREKLHYSFKRCSSRPLKHDFRIAKLKKILFSIKICKKLHKSTVLVNIDESVFSRSTKTNYS